MVVVLVAEAIYPLSLGSSAISNESSIIGTGLSRLTNDSLSNSELFHCPEGYAKCVGPHYKGGICIRRHFMLRRMQYARCETQRSFTRFEVSANKEEVSEM